MSKGNQSEIYRYVHECIKVNPNSVVIYKKIERDINEPLIRFKKEGQIRKNIHNGFISDIAASNLKKAIFFMFWLNDGYGIKKKICYKKTKNNINFITLTLPSLQKHSDKFLKKECLNQFFIELNAKFMNLNYIWRAEKQQNGNIHFHILINKFVKWQYIREIWNRILNKYEYIDNYQQKFLNCTFDQYFKIFRAKGNKDIEKIRQSYISGQNSNWSNPNSIDIQKIRDVKNLLSYVVKYMSKKSPSSENNDSESLNNQKIEGKIWYASECLLNIKQDTQEVTNELFKELDMINQNSTVHIIEKDYYTIFCISADMLLNIGCIKLFQLFYKSLKFK